MAKILSRRKYKKLKSTSEYKFSNKNIKVVDMSDKIIFPLGMFNSIAVINDDLYSEFEGKFNKIKFHGFDYSNWKETGEITNKLKQEHFKNYDDTNHISQHCRIFI